MDENTRLDILEYAPENTKNYPIVLKFWLDCLRWSMIDKEIIKSFEFQTDTKADFIKKSMQRNIYYSPEDEMNRRIDLAYTCSEQDSIKDFVIWFNKNIWEGNKGDI